MKINKWLFVGVLLLDLSFSNQGRASIALDPKTFMYGKWQCKRYEWWNYSSYTEKQADQIKASTLHVEEDRVYFEGISFVEPHKFKKDAVEVKKMTEFDGNHFEHVVHRSPLRREYTEKEFRELYEINLGDGLCLSTLFMDKETLIIHYCGGATFFLEKLPHVQQTCEGQSNAEHVLMIPEHSTYVDVLYRFTGPGILTVQDQSGQELYYEVFPKKVIASTKLPLSQVSKLTFKVMSSLLEDKWWFDASIY